MVTVDGEPHVLNILDLNLERYAHAFVEQYVRFSAVQSISQSF
jgi:hypothetical protein